MHEFNSPIGAEWAGLGMVGGFVRVIVGLLGSDKLPPPIKIFWLLIGNGLVSGFSGYMGAVAMSTFTSNDKLHVVAAGMFGWLGVMGLEFLAEKLKNRIKL